MSSASTPVIFPSSIISPITFMWFITTPPCSIDGLAQINGQAGIIKLAIEIAHSSPELLGLYGRQ